MYMPEDSARRTHTRLVIICACFIAATYVLPCMDARAQCSNPPPSTPLEILVDEGLATHDSSVGMDALGRFIVAYRQFNNEFYPCEPPFGSTDMIVVRHYCQDGSAATGRIPVTIGCNDTETNFVSPSIALDPDGNAIVGLIGYDADYHDRGWETFYVNYFRSDCRQPPASESPVTRPARTPIGAHRNSILVRRSAHPRICSLAHGPGATA